MGYEVWEEGGQALGGCEGWVGDEGEGERAEELEDGGRDEDGENNGGDVCADDRRPVQGRQPPRPRLRMFVIRPDWEEWAFSR
jgi:hypothetical protein